MSAAIAASEFRWRLNGGEKACLAVLHVAVVVTVGELHRQVAELLQTRNGQVPAQAKDVLSFCRSVVLCCLAPTSCDSWAVRNPRRLVGCCDQQADEEYRYLARI